MVTVPNRMAELRSQLEAGQPLESIDTTRLFLLQQLDMVIAGREFVEEAARRDDTETEWIKQQWGDATTPII